jgi:phosphoribosylglycinamide formyltransferase-1
VQAFRFGLLCILMSESQRGQGRELGHLLRLAVLGSGRGSNLEAILAAIEEGKLRAQVVLVISDIADARILKVARKAGVPVLTLDGGANSKPYSETDLLVHLAECGADLVILAGFMRIIRQPMLDAWPRRILNIHPSLLPKHPGLRAWEKALNAGDGEAGCTVHVVDEGVDSGPILGQARVPILPGDDADALHARIQEQEYRLYPQVIAAYAAKLLG